MAFLYHTVYVHHNKNNKGHAAMIDMAGTSNARQSLNPKQVVFRVTGFDDRVSLRDELNDRLVVLCKPNYYSQADCLYQHILQNPNRHISYAEIETAFERKFSMSCPEMVSNLSFTGALRHLFFRVSRYGLFFHNPITWERMIAMQMSVEDIEPYFAQAEKERQSGDVRLIA